MRDRIYVMGFDNTIVDGEDLLADLTAEVLGIDMTRDFWYEHVHTAKSSEDEFATVERSFNTKYTPEKQKAMGERFVKELLAMDPVPAVEKVIRVHPGKCWVLTGSPATIVRMYLDAHRLDIEDDHIIGGVYNGSGKKEEWLREKQRECDVVYIDDDATLVRNAQDIVTEAYLVPHPYNGDTEGLKKLS